LYAARYGALESALISATFTIHSESGPHLYGTWKAGDALKAAVLMDVSLAELPEYMLPSSQCQRVIVHGGDQPNVILSAV
jgi:metal-dependent amidase/aminoacylase/carboxypeptidase family protein